MTPKVQLCFDRQGKPMSTEEWARLMGAKDENWDAVFRVDSTTLPDGKWVSTVWLGLDHGDGADQPLIFETMVFSRFERPREELDSRRYATEEEARTGHAEVVKEWTAKMVDENPMDPDETWVEVKMSDGRTMRVPPIREASCECGAKSQGVAHGQVGHADYCPAK